MLLIYLIWSSERKFADFGIAPPNLKGLLLGIAVFCVIIVTAIPYYAWAFSLHTSWLWRPGTRGTWLLWQSLLTMTIGVTREELMFRSFIQTRLRDINWSPVATVVFVAFLFAVPHIYEGSGVLPIIFIHGIIFGTIYLRTKSIWPALVGHLLYDAFLYVEPTL